MEDKDTRVTKFANLRSQVHGSPSAEAMEVVPTHGG